MDTISTMMKRDDNPLKPRSHREPKPQKEQLVDNLARAGLRCILKDRKITKSRFAEMIGWSPQMLSAYIKKNGKSLTPHTKTFADALNITAVTLVLPSLSDPIVVQILQLLNEFDQDMRQGVLKYTIDKKIVRDASGPKKHSMREVRGRDTHRRGNGNDTNSQNSGGRKEK